MAALDQVTTTSTMTGVAASALFKSIIWSWFNAHESDVLFTKWGFLKVTVGMCRPLITAIAGPESLAT
jgi:hypothetical protein